MWGRRRSPRSSALTAWTERPAIVASSSWVKPAVSRSAFRCAPNDPGAPDFMILTSYREGGHVVARSPGVGRFCGWQGGDEIRVSMPHYLSRRQWDDVCETRLHRRRNLGVAGRAPVILLIRHRRTDESTGDYPSRVLLWLRRHHVGVAGRPPCHRLRSD